MREAFYVGPDEVREYLEIAASGDENTTSLVEYVSGYGEWALREYSESGLVPQPELTGYGWLNLNELLENLAHAKVAKEELTPPCLAAIAAMESLAASISSDKVGSSSGWACDPPPRHITSACSGAREPVSQRFECYIVRPLMPGVSVPDRHASRHCS